MKFINAFFIGVLSLASFACDDDQGSSEPETDQITTIILNLEDEGTMESLRFEYKDLDGDAATPPEIVLDTLNARAAYQAQLELFNEEKSPSENVSDRVVINGTSYQVFYVLDIPEIGVSYEDMDGQGNPIGLETRIIAGSASEGTLRVVLRKDLNKNSSSVRSGDITNADGDTVFDISFNVVIRE